MFSFKKILLTVIVLLLAALMLGQRDDQLSQASKTLIERVDLSASNTAYLYLSGLFAHQDEDPESVGRERLAEYRKFENDQSYQMAEYPKAKKIVLPKGELFCVTSDEGCLETLFRTDFDIEQIREKHAVLISRINTFHGFAEYITLSKPTVEEILPPYQYLVRAERIATLGAIAHFKQGDSDQAVEQLMQQLQRMRAALRKQDNIVGKMVFSRMLSEKIDVLSVTLSQANTVQVTPLIASLSANEKDFSIAAAREFMLSYHLFTGMDRHPEILQKGGNSPGWLTRLFFKPNVSTNAITPKFYRLERLATLAPSEFAQALSEPALAVPKTSSLRNFVGNMLISIQLDFDGYVGRMIDVDAKLALFNQRYHLQQDIALTQNPYFADETPQITEDKACFSGPLEDMVAMRCLKINLLNN